MEEYQNHAHTHVSDGEGEVFFCFEHLFGIELPGGRMEGLLGPEVLEARHHLLPRPALAGVLENALDVHYSLRERLPNMDSEIGF